MTDDLLSLHHYLWFLFIIESLGGALGLLTFLIAKRQDQKLKGAANLLMVAPMWFWTCHVLFTLQN